VSMRKPIYVTQPFLPPLAEFVPLLEQIWENRILTNAGPFHQQLESALCEYLRVPQVSLFANGTLGLITALQALRITGEVITTPYSFVATAHALLWHGNRPVFVDVEPATLNIDPERIEAAITPQTTAILPVHCYGNPCDVEAIGRIADTYNLRVIYDAAHAFGVRLGERSLMGFGDLSVLSFHATKVFNTFEGGAIVSANEQTKRRIDQLKNFGFVDEITVVAPGINAKMSEVNAAFGLLQLRYLGQILERRAAIAETYRAQLADVRGIRCLARGEQSTANHAYFPVLVEPDYPLSRDALYARLKEYGIVTRRYFYPLISNFPMYRGMDSAAPANLPVANLAASRVLCLPIYPALGEDDLERIIDLVRGWARS